MENEQKLRVLIRECITTLLESKKAEITPHENSKEVNQEIKVVDDLVESGKTGKE